MMKKRLLLCLAICIFLVSSALIPVSAESWLPRLVDNADLLSYSEESALLSLLDEISEYQLCDIVIVTVDSLDGKSAEAYADDFFDYNEYGYGDDYAGILLLLSMEYRDWAISTCGFGIYAFTDSGIAYIFDKISPSLGNNDFYTAFVDFAEYCDIFLEEAYTNEPYEFLGGGSTAEREPTKPITKVIISLIISIIISFIVLGIMKSSLKSVSMQAKADSYVRSGSMNVTHSRDIYLYRTVSRTARPKSSSGSSGGGSSTHSSSSGSSHGGSSGKF